MVLNGDGNIAAGGALTLGSGNLTKNDVGTLTLSYSGNQTMMSSGQALGGLGAGVGNVTQASSATTTQQTDGAAGTGTLTFITIGTAAEASFDCSSSAGSGNDPVVLTNASARLNGNRAQITINQISGVDTLAAADHVLFNLIGTFAAVVSKFNPLPAWLPAAPSSADSCSIVTSNKQVIPHYVAPNPKVLTSETAAPGSGSVVAVMRGNGRKLRRSGLRRRALK